MLTHLQARTFQILRHDGDNDLLVYNNSPKTQNAILTGDYPARTGRPDPSMAPPVLVVGLQRHRRLHCLPFVASFPIP